MAITPNVQLKNKNVKTIAWLFVRKPRDGYLFVTIITHHSIPLEFFHLSELRLCYWAGGCFSKEKCTGLYKLTASLLHSKHAVKYYSRYKLFTNFCHIVYRMCDRSIELFWKINLLLRTWLTSVLKIRVNFLYVTCGVLPKQECLF